MTSCGPKTVSGWYCRGGLLTAIMFQSFGAMCFFEVRTKLLFENLRTEKVDPQAKNRRLNRTEHD